MLVFQSSRWLRHQHTEESGFLGPSIVATSPNRAVVAGRTTMLTGPGYARSRPQLSWWQSGAGGTSSAGLPSKKPSALSWNPTRVTGITGQSSGRTT